MDKLVQLINHMHGQGMIYPCHYINAMTHLIGESGLSPEIAAEIRKMAEGQRQVCAAYNNLRRQLAIEGQPDFYVGEESASSRPTLNCCLVEAIPSAAGAIPQCPPRPT